MRSFRVPANLRREVPNGFCIKLTEAPEDYFGLLAEMFQVQLEADKK